MFGSQVLEIAVGLVFVYLLLSIICTAANELIASLFSLRARNLAKGIANLLADKRLKGLEELLYDHPLIKGIGKGSSKPSYIPARTFALAFLDGIAPAKGDGAAAMQEIKAAVSSLPADSELKRVLLVLMQEAGDDLGKFRDSIETWFNSAMDRVAGWYKRQSQLMILILGLLLAGGMNADTLGIVKSLSIDPALRAAVVSRAQQYVSKQSGAQAQQGGENMGGSGAAANAGGASAAAKPNSEPAAAVPAMDVKQAGQELAQLGIPLGWQQMPKKDEWPNKTAGLLLTAFAISLGAPFWFDLLGKITNIRSSGAVPGTSTKEEKKENPT